MSRQAEQVYALLERKRIPYRRAEHPAVHTIEEMLALSLDQAEAVTKNLFLRDDKKRNYYLVTVRQDRHVDLKALRTLLGSRPLSFASPPDLKRMLGLEPGAVTPFGVLEDQEHIVTVALDAAFRPDRIIGIHPNDNTQTVWLSAADLKQVLQEAGAPFLWLELEPEGAAVPTTEA